MDGETPFLFQNRKTSHTLHRPFAPALIIAHEIGNRAHEIGNHAQMTQGTILSQQDCVFHVVSSK